MSCEQIVPTSVNKTKYWVSPFGDPTFSNSTFSDPSDPTFTVPTLKRVVSLVCFLVAGGNIFNTTEASANL